MRPWASKPGTPYCSCPFFVERPASHVLFLAAAIAALLMGALGAAETF